MNIKPIFTPPPTAEIDARIDQVRHAMVKNKLDYYVSFSPDNIFYLTNFANTPHERPFVLVIPLQGDISFLIPKLEIPHVSARSIGELNLISYREFPAPIGESWLDGFHPLFTPGARVGVESICPLQVYEAIPGERIKLDVIDDLRMVKSDYEIGRITYASNIATEVHNNLLENAQLGQTLKSVSAEYSGQIMRKIIADYPETNIAATKFIVVFQPNSVSHDPHNSSNISIEMARGGNTTIINGIANGYGTEVERTFFLGAVPEQAKKPFDVMTEARQLAYELTVPGNSMSYVDEQVNQVFHKAGYEQNLLHRTGHSIGVTGHEAPFLAEGYDRQIEPGMIFTIEPGVYIPGIGGFRHSDTVLITETGNRALTSGPETLEELTYPVN